jgi:hypothetical protein
MGQFAQSGASGGELWVLGRIGEAGFVVWGATVAPVALKRRLVQEMGAMPSVQIILTASPFGCGARLGSELFLLQISAIRRIPSR